MTPTMLEWQHQQLLGEIQQVELHASDPECPCNLADAGEWCIPKHLLNIATLAAETAAMSATPGEIGEELYSSLRKLSESARQEHTDAIIAIKTNIPGHDLVSWARHWRKEAIEPLYYGGVAMKTEQETAWDSCIAKIDGDCVTQEDITLEMGKIAKRLLANVEYYPDDNEYWFRDCEWNTHVVNAVSEYLDQLKLDNTIRSVPSQRIVRVKLFLTQVSEGAGNSWPDDLMITLKVDLLRDNILKDMKEGKSIENIIKEFRQSFSVNRDRIQYMEDYEIEGITIIKGGQSMSV